MIHNEKSSFTIFCNILFIMRQKFWKLQNLGSFHTYSHATKCIYIMKTFIPRQQHKFIEHHTFLSLLKCNFITMIYIKKKTLILHSSYIHKYQNHSLLILQNESKTCQMGVSFIQILKCIPKYIEGR